MRRTESPKHWCYRLHIAFCLTDCRWKISHNVNSFQFRRFQVLIPVRKSDIRSEIFCSFSVPRSKCLNKILIWVEMSCYDGGGRHWKSEGWGRDQTGACSVSDISWPCGPICWRSTQAKRWVWTEENKGEKWRRRKFWNPFSHAMICDAAYL
jgi:hypothetical protein